MMFSNFNKKAAWKSKLYSKEEWLKSLSFKHPLFDLPFLSGENVEPDELHIFYSGMLQYFYGSTLWLLTYSILKGTPEENAEFIWRKIIEHYEANPTSTQIGNLQLSMFVGDVKQPKKFYPRLKVKGSECKHLSPALLSIWDTMTKKSRSEFRAPVMDALVKQVEIQSVLDDNRFNTFLSVDDAKTIADSVNDFLIAYSHAASKADKADLKLFSVTPKFHWSYHWAQRSVYLNPRLGNCMVDESFRKKSKECAKACTASTPLHKVPERFMIKYRWGSHFESI